MSLKALLSFSRENLMTYDSLIKSGRIRPYQATNQEIHKILALAKRDIGAAN
jgi:hypothetical protein